MAFFNLTLYHHYQICFGYRAEYADERVAQDAQIALTDIAVIIAVETNKESCYHTFIITDAVVKNFTKRFHMSR